MDGLDLGVSGRGADGANDFSQAEVCLSTAFQNLRVAPKMVCRLRAKINVPTRKIAVSHPKVLKPLLSGTIRVLKIALNLISKS